MNLAPATLPKIYRRIALFFLIVPILTLLVTVYLSWSRATIIVTTETQNTKLDFVFAVSGATSTVPIVRDDMVSGRIFSIDEHGTGTFSATGTSTPTSNSVGIVTILNASSHNQVLVEKTRLSLPSAPDTVVVRLKQTVTVPANGQVSVAVYPDNAQAFTDIPAGKFLIPGLPVSLRSQIYAQSSQTLSTHAASAAVTQSDLDQAKTTLKDQLYQKALTDAGAQLAHEQSNWPKLVSSTLSKVTYSAKVGEGVPSFTATSDLTAVVIAFNEDQVVAMAHDKLTAGLPTGKNLINIDPKNFTYTLDSYDPITKQAKVHVKAQGDLGLTDINAVIDKNKLLGLTVDEVKAYFAGFPDIKSVDVRLSPAWLTKTPSMPEKIEIQVTQ